MGLLKWLLAYSAADHLLKKNRPQPVVINLHVELPPEQAAPAKSRPQPETEPPRMNEREEREYKQQADRAFWRTLEGGGEGGKTP